MIKTIVDNAVTKYTLHRGKSVFGLIKTGKEYKVVSVLRGTDGVLVNNKTKERYASDNITLTASNKRLIKMLTETR